MNASLNPVRQCSIAPAASLPRATRRGVALILTLAFLVLLSAVVLAFFSRAMTTRQVSYSSAGQARAEQIAGTALWTLTADLIDEMRAGSENPDARPGDLFQPANADLSRPFRSPVNPDITNLLTGSFPGQPLWQGDAYDFAGPVRVYDDGANSTLEPSANHRFVRNSRWGLPRLHDDDTQFESNFTPPGWVYVAREGPLEVESEEPDFEEWSDRDPDNDDYVVGRFAYMVYDVGGLLDINLAGSREDLLPDGLISRGSHQAFADLSLIGGMDVDTLVDWRHAGSIGEDEYAALYENMEWDFRRPWPGDQAFVTRQDLLAAVDEQTGLLGPDGTALGLEHLPKLTVFSRSRNAPFRQPGGTDRAGTPVAVDEDFNPHPLAPGVRVQAEFTRRDGSTARVGEPLIKNRFPLSKLALLDNINSTSGNVTNPDQLEEIHAYFGLEPYDDDGYSWRYDPELAFEDADGRFGIRTLGEVAQQNREPNFFEMLKAAILHGSLGSHSDDDAAIETSIYDRNPALQILQIGANLIDQYDRDDFPTTILFPSPEGDVEIFGRENLPYIYAIGTGITRPLNQSATWQNSGLDFVGGWYQFALWNPHQNALDGLRDGSPVLLQLRAHQGRAQVELLTFYETWVIPRHEEEYEADVSEFYSPPGAQSEWRDFSEEPSLLRFLNEPEKFYDVTFLDIFRHQWEARTIPNVGDPRNHVDWSNVNTAGYPIGSRTAPRFSGIFVGHVQAHEPDAPNYDQAMANLREEMPDEEYRDPNVSEENFNPEGNLRNSVMDRLYKPEWGVNPRFRWGYLLPDLANPPVFDLEVDVPGVGYRPYQRVDGLIGGSPRTRHYHPSPWFLYGFYNPGSPTNGNWFAHSGFGNYDPRSLRYGMFRLGNFRQMARRLRAPTDLPDPHPVRGRGEDSPEEAFPRATGGSSHPDFPVGGRPSGEQWLRTDTDFYAGALTDNTNLPTWADTDRNNYVVDPDGVLRRADGTHGEGSSPHLAGPGHEHARPVILNRPFRSVGDMGYAFRDQPWKNLNFFRTESADLALLDYFSMEESPVVAGRIDLNTRHTDLLVALLSGGTVRERDDAEVLDTDLATQVAESLAGVSGPFTGLDDVVRHLEGQAFMPSPPHKSEHEAVIRRLANTVQTRTWNVLIDVVAQAGRFPDGSQDFSNFVVEGERRYWLHLAIDRYTGEVVDYMVEGVQE